MRSLKKNIGGPMKGKVCGLGKMHTNIYANSIRICAEGKSLLLAVNRNSVNCCLGN